jgi:hypothetical protein
MTKHARDIFTISSFTLYQRHTLEKTSGNTMKTYFSRCKNHCFVP